jgi:uncharacterized Fe-S cluster-containing radical SAM superfamily protein
MDGSAKPAPARLDPRKFIDPFLTFAGEHRASVTLETLSTLWLNTGTLCNLTCRNCYIESSPKNDRLSYLTLDEVRGYLDEIAEGGLATTEIGFTGGEPFMNPEITDMLALSLQRRFRVLVLTNAMRPMMKLADRLAGLNRLFPGRLVIRVSLDHYRTEMHELERGRRSWQPTIDGLRWLTAEGFTINVAGRTCWDENEDELREGYGRLFAAEDISVDAHDPVQLVLFPEMDANVDVPEITESCWSILGVAPSSMMCATSRMVVKRKGEARPVVVPCTLLPYDPQFDLGHRLGEAGGAVPLNHPHCAKFCVLGGGSCSAA